MELTRHADTEVRELALFVLDAVGGTLPNRVFFERLRDPNEMIRFRACELLAKRSKQLDLTSVQEELRSNPDAEIRDKMARLLGEREDGNTLDQLRSLLNHEVDLDVRHSIRLAMARLGERAQYPAILEIFKRDEPKARLAALSDLEYVGSRSLVKDVIFMLDDTRDVLNVGFSHSPEYVRVCDVAVNTFDRLLTHPFKFSVDKIPRRYTESELQEAKQL
jgi:HEAT repeat protein